VASVSSGACGRADLFIVSKQIAEVQR